MTILGKARKNNFYISENFENDPNHIYTAFAFWVNDEIKD